MKIESPVLGTVEVDDDKLIEFPAGLSGFDDLRRFALLHDEASKNKELFLLLSLEDPDILFSVTAPENLSIHYELRLSDEESATIGLADPEQAAVLVILRRDDEPASPSSAGLRANFMAPLVLNLTTRRGLQKIMSRMGCEVTLRSL